MKKITFAFLFSATTFYSLAQLPAASGTNKEGSQYQFSVVKELDHTGVKNQFHSGTCWCFSAQSFLESELMRMGKGEYDLSEMYIVRCAYLEKAENYIRWNGKCNFGPGGEPHDVMAMIKKYGLMPKSAYPGNVNDLGKPEHNEMDAVLKAMLDEMLKTPDGKLSPRWKDAFQGALDGYMGAVPAEFEYDGKKYTPLSFAKMLGINPDDYVEITSFTHHPFYAPFVIEIPDNWMLGQAYNVPLDELQQIAESAVKSGYSIEWASDVSEKTFSYKNGIALVPAKNWDDMKQSERDSLWIVPTKEKTITQAMRQESFDNLTTTDDHGMHITGLATAQNGTEFFMVKNSWGTDNPMNGYFYCSMPFFLYKTTGIMVNKNAIPAAIRKKLGI